MKYPRELFRIEGNTNGVNLVFIGGMHGNEPSGVEALLHFESAYSQSPFPIDGNIYAFTGNRKALERNVRYIDEDLNRIWQVSHVDLVMRGEIPEHTQTAEDKELFELWTEIKKLMDERSGPFIFIDLHTTSVDTVPFITMSDTLMNRSFARHIPVPVVIGIEEFLNEPFLSFVNELGCISFAFEAGQHEAKSSVENHVHLIWMSIFQAGLSADKQNLKLKDHSRSLYKNADKNHQIYEIRSRCGIDTYDRFKMNPGFKNFSPISQGEHLAYLNNEKLYAEENGYIFMPLYQKQGSDGYFTIRPFSKFWLGVSWIFRRAKLHNILPTLPGVTRSSEPDQLLVDPQVAKWYSTEVLHLMGYRRKVEAKHHTVFLKRTYDFKGPR